MSPESNTIDFRFWKGIITAMILLVCLSLHAQVQNDQDKKVFVSGEQLTLQSIFKMITEQTNIRLFYNSAQLNDQEKMTVHFQSVSLEEVLQTLLKDKGLSWIYRENTVILQLKRKEDRTLSDSPPVKELSGSVTDSKGYPLSNVTITLKGKPVSKVTAGDGSFSLKAAEGDVLIFSSIGYLPKERKVTKEIYYPVVLGENVVALGDMVVVGYGRQDRKDLSSSISSLKNEDLNLQATSDIGQLLQGKVAGLNITASGDPNRLGAIVLRGASTLNQAQSPLFVIDGAPGGDISSLAPDDIATVDVLKDAAATAIYGNRGANGVIMITTRKPKKGQLQVMYNGYGATEKVSHQLRMMDAGQLRAFLARSNLSFIPADDKGANTNWQNAVENPTAFSHNHNIYLAQGNESTIFNASLNYYYQQGIIQTSSLERVIARLSIDQYTLNGKLKLGLAVTNSSSNANFVPYRNTVLKQMLQYLPVSPVKNPDGSYFDDFTHTTYYNPVSLIHHGKENLKYSNILGIFTAQLKLPFGLKYDIALSYQNYSTLYGAYYDSYYTQYYNNIRSTPDPPANPQLITLTGSNGEAVRNTYQNTNKIVETFFTWDIRSGGHSVNAVLGYSFQETVNGEGFQATSTNFPVDNIGYNNLALSNPYAIPGFNVDFGTDNYEHNRLIADFARVNYNYKDKYLLQASIRRDGSSVFGVNHRWGYFPAVGMAWKFSNLKLRASYGVTGNSLGFNPTAAQALSGNIGSYYYQGAQLIAIGPTQSANPDLRWERTTTADIGLDFSMAKGRLSGTLEVYNKRTTDLIWSYPVDPNLVPSGSITANVGAMNNKGIEMSIHANPVHSAAFNWTTSLNLAHNENEIVSLSNSRFRMDSIQEVEPDGVGQSGVDLQILLSGKPIGQFYTLKYAGDSSGISQYVNAKGKLTTVPAPGTTDYHLAGNAQPKLLIGWENKFRYKNFDFTIFLRSVLGNKIFNVTLANLDQPNSAQNVNIPLSIAGESPKNYNAGRYSTRYIESGSYWRLDNASLGYSFSRISRDIRSLRLYIAANNLFVITGYKGIDPEVNQGGLAPGVDASNFYPKTRTFLFGVNLSL